MKTSEEIIAIITDAIAEEKRLTETSNNIDKMIHRNNMEVLRNVLITIYAK